MGDEVKSGGGKMFNQRVEDLLPVDSLRGDELHLLPQDDYKQHQLTNDCDCLPLLSGRHEGQEVWIHCEGVLNGQGSRGIFRPMGADARAQI